MSTTAPVSPAFAAVLKAERDVFNARYTEARRLHPDMDPRTVSALLRECADPVVSAVAVLDSDRVPAVAQAVYEAVLTLAGERLTGPGGRFPLIAEMWQRLLPAAAPLVADQPQRVIAALTNAMVHLCGTPGTRPQAWLESMAAISPALPSAADLRRAGQLAAWRAGLAHYRDGALAAGDALPGQVAAALMGAPRARWSALRTRLAVDLWWDPAAAATPPGPRMARTAGAFRGFGGLFPLPPCITVSEGQLVATSDGSAWLLTADVFGATFHRADPALAAAATGDSLTFRGNAVTAGGVTLTIPGIGDITSAAIIPGTAAVTGSLTHAVTLIALT